LNHVVGLWCSKVFGYFHLFFKLPYISCTDSKDPHWSSCVFPVPSSMYYMFSRKRNWSCWLVSNVHSWRNLTLGRLVTYIHRQAHTNPLLLLLLFCW
jgi:hypothetical protein